MTLNVMELAVKSIPFFDSKDVWLQILCPKVPIASHFARFNLRNLKSLCGPYISVRNFSSDFNSNSSLFTIILIYRKEFTVPHGHNGYQLDFIDTRQRKIINNE